MSINKLNYGVIFTLCSLRAQAFQLGTDLTLSYENNVSVAESSHDIFSDSALGLSVIASQSFRLNPRSSLSIKGKLERNEFARFDDLSNTSLAIAGMYRIQPVVGFYQPWFALNMNVEKLVYDHSDIRSGTKFNVSTAIHQRLTERLSTSVGGIYEKRIADEADVFAWQRYSMF